MDEADRKRELLWDDSLVRRCAQSARRRPYAGRVGRVWLTGTRVTAQSLVCCLDVSLALGHTQLRFFAPADTNIGWLVRAAADAAELEGGAPPWEADDTDCRPQDWVAHIKASYRPTEAVPGVWIVPDWQDEESDEGETFEAPEGAMELILQPGVAFGTGDHPTTRLCMASLRRMVCKGDSVLDYGAGSGVLAILALRMGAGYAVGVDIDPMAVNVAQVNARLNGFQEDAFRCYIVDPEDPHARPLSAEASTTFDVVVANILRGPLLSLEPALAAYARPGAKLVLSGLLAGAHAEEVLAAYAAHFDGLEVATMGEWACVTGTKRE